MFTKCILFQNNTKCIYNLVHIERCCANCVKSLEKGELKKQLLYIFHFTVKYLIFQLLNLNYQELSVATFIML